MFCYILKTPIRLAFGTLAIHKNKFISLMSPAMAKNMQTCPNLRFFNFAKKGINFFYLLFLPLKVLPKSFLINSKMDFSIISILLEFNNFASKYSSK